MRLMSNFPSCISGDCANRYEMTTGDALETVTYITDGIVSVTNIVISETYKPNLSLKRLSFFQKFTIITVVIKCNF